MKRTVGALGLLGLVYAVSLPAANAATLWQPDLSKDKLEGVNGLYIQGIGTNYLADPSSTAIGVAAFLIDHDKDEVGPSGEPDQRKNGWLDGADSVGVAESPGDDTSTDPTVQTAPFMLLTGDPKWADVAIQSKIVAWEQNGGTVSLVLRAAPKTKVSDSDSRYEFRYTTTNEIPLASEVRDGIEAATDTVTDADGETARGVNVRLLKVVNGKWKLLADQNADSSTVYIPRVNRLGIDHDVNKAGDDDGNQPADTLVGAYFRFVAKGDLLQGFVSMDGKKFDKVIEAHDSDLKAGLVGFSHYDYHPLFKEILVEDTP